MIWQFRINLLNLQKLAIGLKIYDKAEIKD